MPNSRAALALFQSVFTRAWRISGGRVITLHRSGEDAAGPWTRAISGNYLDVRVAGRWPANDFLDARISGVKDDALVGAAS